MNRELGENMRERVAIGKICYKGPHIDLIGNSDYGSCGSHEYATIYITVEEDYPNPRGGGVELATIAAEIAEIVATAESHMWCASD